MFFTGDVIVHTQDWYPEGDTNAEGFKLNELFTDLSLHQLISKPIHFFRSDFNLSCVDVILTDQPNIFLDSCVRLSP